MPITLGCPSCGKRFRARDESVGRRVKCPFCQAAVSVPSPEEASRAGAPTDVVPVPSSGKTAPPPGRPPALPPPPGPKEPALFDVAQVPSRPAPPPAVTPGAAEDWGASDHPPNQIILEDEPDTSPPPSAASRSGRAARPAPPAEREREPRTGRGAKPARPGRAEPPAATTPEEAVTAWRRTRSGLGWVLFGVFWFALIGFVPFGKLVYERAVEDLPKGPGQVRIEGYINSDGPNAIKLDRREELDLLLYGVPVLLGGLAVVFGRVRCGAVPRASGAKGLFLFSGLFALIAFTGLVTLPVCQKVELREVAGYARTAAVVGGGLSEFWFLLALAACAATLRRPAAVRAVGLFALVVGFAYLVVTVGWEQYLKYGPEIGRPKKPDPDWQFYETAAKMLGWLVLVGTYWRAVRAVRRAIREYLEDVRDGVASTPTR
jgi:hypothetical protein